MASSLQCPPRMPSKGEGVQHSTLKSAVLFGWLCIMWPSAKNVECVFVCVCVISFMCCVWYVVCNCLCLTIHHRAVFLTLSLLSSVTNLFSLLQENFFQNHSDKCFFFFKLNESIHNKLSRKRLRGGLEGEEETSSLPSKKTIKADSTELSKSVTPPKHWGPTLGKWKTLHWHKTQHSL